MDEELENEINEVSEGVRRQLIREASDQIALAMAQLYKSLRSEGLKWYESAYTVAVYFSDGNRDV